jgi:hypothetical protein
MSSEKDILKKLREKGETFEMDVSDGLWAEIEKGISEDPPPKRGGWIFWVYAGVFAIVATLSSFFLLGRTEMRTQNRSVHAHSQMRFSDDIRNISETKEMRPNQTVSRKDILKSQEIIVENEVASESAEKPTQQANMFSESQASVVENHDQTNEPNKSQVNFDRSIVEIKTSESINSNSVERNKFEHHDSVLVTSEPESDTLIVNETPEVLVEELDTENTVFMAEDSIAQVDSVLSNVPITVANEQAGRFGVLLLGGAGTSYRTFKSDVFHHLVEHKDAHETFGRAYRFGLLVNWSLSDRLFLRTGLLYSHYSEHYEFHHDVINHTTDNRYDYFKLPLQLGYRVLTWKNADVSLVPGINWNLLQRANSSWVDPDLLEPVIHSNETESGPFRNGTFGWSFAVDARLGISNKWSLHLIPGVDGFAQSVYKRTTELVQRPFAFSGAVGLSYQF